MTSFKKERKIFTPKQPVVVARRGPSAKETTKQFWSKYVDASGTLAFHFMWTVLVPQFSVKRNQT